MTYFDSRNTITIIIKMPINMLYGLQTFCLLGKINGSSYLIFYCTIIIQEFLMLISIFIITFFFKYWTLLKSRTKIKAEQLQHATLGTEGGPNCNNTPLTPMEEHILGIIGKKAVKGEPEMKINVSINRYLIIFIFCSQ